MSKSVDSFYALYNNPFLLSGIVVEFYKHYSFKQQNDILLSYLILPLTLYESSKAGLQRANKQRSIRTFVKEPERLFGLAERLKEYKKMTNLTMQFAIDQRYLLIDEVLSVKVDSSNEITMNPGLKPHLTAAANLAKMLNAVDVISVYRQFGIKRI
ncbi:MAG: hypothetical protein JWP94_947 [Mucilaginibacter sp.]|nr:hypothetical protein [Mucilaginibacter sp.]